MLVASCIILSIFALLLLWILAVRCRHGHSLLPTLRQYRYAHRGLHSADRPENSLAAFQAAVDHGYGAELDVHLTADGALVVMHDDTTKRLCGADWDISSVSLAQLQTLRLNGTTERIPLLEDVLQLFNGRAPLVIELKTVHHNASALCMRVFETLDHYSGAYCIESFDPRVLLWLRRNRPDVCRGQLSARFSKGEAAVSAPLRFCLKHLLMNFLTTPDFIAYDHVTRQHTASLSICRRVWGAQEFSWTIRDMEHMRQMEQLGSLVIFEQFCPPVSMKEGANSSRR